MKLIYKWDGQSIFSGTKLAEDDYQLQANECFDAIPQPNLMPIKRINNGTAWRSATQEEHDAYVKQQQALYPQQQSSNEPTTQDKLNATTTVQLANLMQANQQQEQINANLTLQIAQLLKADQTTDTKTTDTTAQAKA